MHTTPSNNLFPLLGQLFHHVSQRRRRQFALLLGLTLICSIAEVVSLGAVIPFIGVLTSQKKVFNYPEARNVVHMLGITSAEDLIIPVIFVFAVVALLAGGLRLLLLWVSIRLANGAGADLSVEVYRRTLYQPYKIHVARNSSEIISGITKR